MFLVVVSLVHPGCTFKLLFRAFKEKSLINTFTIYKAQVGGKKHNVDPNY